MQKYRTMCIWGVAVALSLVVATVLVLRWLGAYHRGGVDGVTARIVVVDGQAELRVEGPDHPPWAQSHVIAADYDYDNRVVTIARYNAWNVFESPLYREWPLIIRQRLVFDGEYLVRYWSGEEYIELGRATMKDRQLSFVAKGKG